MVKKPGSYQVLVGRGKILSTFSDSIQISTKPSPAKPTIILESSNLKSSSTNNNSWYLNGVALKDSTNQYLKSFGSGVYTVKVFQNGCFSESDNFIITSIEQKENNIELKIYPNPNEGFFWVELPKNYKMWQTDIFDAQGNLIFEKTNTNSKIENIKINPKPGIYILRVTIGNLKQHVKFVIN